MFNCALLLRLRLFRGATEPFQPDLPSTSDPPPGPDVDLIWSWFWSEMSKSLGLPCLQKCVVKCFGEILICNSKSLMWNIWWDLGVRLFHLPGKHQQFRGEFRGKFRQHFRKLRFKFRVFFRGNESIYHHRSGPLLENGLDRPENRYGRCGFASFSSISISTIGLHGARVSL